VNGIRAVLSCAGVLILGLSAVLGTAGCSSSPSTQARACAARAQLLSGVDELRSFDYSTGSASGLAAILNQLRSGLKAVEGAVHLPQNTALDDLGGVGHIRQLSSKIGQVVTELNSRSVDVAALQDEVTLRRGQVEHVADAVTGC
jgi:hypothetical protein